MIGGFFDARHSSWSEAELALFEELIDEDDVEIMAWALGTAEAPEKYSGPLIEALKKLDYVTI